MDSFTHINNVYHDAGESLATWAGRAAPPKSIVYGATELLTGEAFAAQLAELGRRSGAA